MSKSLKSASCSVPATWDGDLMRTGWGTNTQTGVTGHGVQVTDGTRPVSEWELEERASGRYSSGLGETAGSADWKIPRIKSPFPAAAELP